MNAIAKPNEDDLAFAETLALVEAAYRLARPDAQEIARRIYRQYLAHAATMEKNMQRIVEQHQNLEATLDQMKSQGEFYSGRASKVRRLMRQYDSKRLYPTEDPGGQLPEHAVKPARQDPILTLVQKRQITVEQEYAARSIATCFEAAAREGMARIREYDLFMPPPKNSGRSLADRMSSVLAVRHALIYLPWTRDMHASKKLDLPFVLDVVVDGIALNPAAERRKMGWRKGLRILKEALDRWNEIERPLAEVVARAIEEEREEEPAKNHHP